VLIARRAIGLTSRHALEARMQSTAEGGFTLQSIFFRRRDLAIAAETAQRAAPPNRSMSRV
jgi:hypothetical protein